MRGSSLKDRVVVITGASSGIGRACALRFAGEGAAVVLAARRREALEEVAEEVRSHGGTALVVPTDVRDEAAVEALARAATERLGGLDCWVNDAAVSLFGRFEEAPPDVFRAVLETNLFGYIHGARAALPRFREQGRGVLINVGSVVGVVPQPLASAYTTSKFAIRGFTLSLRQELRGSGIEVCSLLPASIDTPLFQHAANYTGRPPRPISPIVPVEDVAEAIVALARRPRREVVVGRSGQALLQLHRLAPGLTEALMARQVPREHFQQERRAAPTEGNVLAPVPRWTGASGGWRESARRRRATRALAAAGAAFVAWRVARRAWAA